MQNTTPPPPPDSRKLKPLILTLLLGFALSVLSGPPVEATTLLHLNADDLLARAGLVVEGTVREVTVDPGDADNLPTTTFLLCDLAVLVGDPAEVSCLPITVPGATIEGRTGGFVGMPMLTPNHRYLLFLRRAPLYTSPFVGWWQGVFRVVEGDHGAAILSSSGYPVEDIDEHGEIRTHREGRLVETPTGSLRIVSDEAVTPLDETDAAALSITRDAFAQQLLQRAELLQRSGRPVPDKLPQRWSVRRERRPEVVAPVNLNEMEVQP